MIRIKEKKTTFKENLYKCLFVNTYKNFNKICKENKKKNKKNI